MKKEHTTKQERNALQTKRALRNRKRNRKPHTAWQNSGFVFKNEVAMRLAHRFADIHEVSHVGLPARAAIRRELEGLDVAQLQELHTKMKEQQDGEG